MSNVEKRFQNDRNGKAMGRRRIRPTREQSASSRRGLRRFIRVCGPEGSWYLEDMSLWASVWRTGLILGLATTVRAGEVGLIKVKGGIGPATASYVARGIQVSTSRQDACLIIELDTPGGALTSTKDIIQSFYASKVPIVVYVAPAGAWAGSAGCFITMAADVAAMAPSTSTGAAHPVSIAAVGVEKTDDVM